VNRRRALLTASAGLVLPWRLYAQPVAPGGPTGYQRPGPGPLWSGLTATPPSLDLSFLSATLDASITWTRAQNTATDGIFTNASGAGFNTFLANAPRISVANGLLIENLRTNNLLNSGVPVTQTTASLATGNWSLWVNGAGTATPSAVTAVGTGFAAASQGTPSTFNLTGAGTVLVTVSGALNRFQLEAGLDVSSYIPTVGVVASRPVDSGTLPVGAWFNATAGTIVHDFLQPQLVTGNTWILPSFWIDSSNTTEIRLVNASLLVASFVANAATGQTPSAGAVTTGIVQRAVTTFDTVSKVVSVSLNGRQPVFVTTTGIATFTQIKFGAVRISPSDGFVRRIRVWPRVLTAQEQMAVGSL
jgi:hypothetical protein